MFGLEWVERPRRRSSEEAGGQRCGDNYRSVYGLLSLEPGFRNFLLLF
jgi:hypothetical protein